MPRLAGWGGSKRVNRGMPRPVPTAADVRLSGIRGSCPGSPGLLRGGQASGQAGGQVSGPVTGSTTSQGTGSGAAGSRALSMSVSAIGS